LLSVIWLNKDLYPLDTRPNAAVALTLRTVVESRKYIASATGQDKAYRYGYRIFENIQHCFKKKKLPFIINKTYRK
jgi:hypothetical protein